MKEKKIVILTVLFSLIIFVFVINNLSNHVVFYNFFVNCLYILVLSFKLRQLYFENRALKKGYEDVSPQITQIVKKLPVILSTILYILYLLEVILHGLSTQSSFILKITILLIVVSTLYVKESNVLIGRDDIIISKKGISRIDTENIKRMNKAGRWIRYDIVSKDGVILPIALNDSGNEKFLKCFKSVCVEDVKEN